MSKYRNFTLLELLTVIAVASVLLTVAVAAFSGFGDSAKVGNAASMVGQELTLAKSAAATRRKPVAVVIADRSINDSSESCLFAALRSGFVDFENNEIGSDDWLSDSEWALLPVAVRVVDVFDGDTSIIDDITVNIDGDVATREIAFVFTPDGVCHKLNTSGSSWSVGAPCNFKIRVAACEDETGDVPSADNYKNVTVNRYTGVIKYEDPE